jgi:hypothetical protein
MVNERRSAIEASRNAAFIRLRRNADCNALAIPSRQSDGTTASVFATWRMTTSAPSVRLSPVHAKAQTKPPTRGMRAEDRALASGGEEGPPEIAAPVITGQAADMPDVAGELLLS